MSNALLSWRNWCTERGQVTVSLGAFEAGAPADNMLTPRTGELAIASSVTPAIQWVCDIGGQDSPQSGRPVGVIALLNHNITAQPSASNFEINLEDEDGNVYQPSGFPTASLFVTPSGEFQSHLFWDVASSPAASVVNLQKIVRITVGIGQSLETGRFDPYTGEVEPELFRFGGLWAGPSWRPVHGLRFDGFQQSISEQVRGARSIGGQFYPLPEPRFRRMQAEFAFLHEREVYSVPETQLGQRIRTMSLQQLASWCGRSRPLIVLPTDTAANLIYTQGIYGYLEQDPTWAIRDAAYDAVRQQKERGYTATLNIAEAL